MYHIKLLGWVVLFTILELASRAQAPASISYQAILRNSEGTLLNDQTVGMRISILQGTVDGPEVFAELHQVVCNSLGRISLVIGGGTNVFGDVANINWAADAYFLKTETDLEGGTAYTLETTASLLSVPYAWHAKVTDHVTNAIVEDDHLFESSVASAITVSDTANWNASIQPVIAGEGIELNGNTISAPREHWIGELYEGGVVAALWEINGEQHGLIAAMSPVGQFPYSNMIYDFVGSDAWNGVNGQQNTEAIIAQAGHNQSAAMACSTYGDGNWYLPSVLELRAIFQNRFVLEQAGATFINFYYWTSTEYANGDSGYGAYAIPIFSGSYYGTLTAISKFNYAYAWPVRQF